MHVEFEDGRVKPIDWEAEIKRIDDKKWTNDPDLRFPARCGALKAVIEDMAKCYESLASLYNEAIEEIKEHV